MNLNLFRKYTPAKFTQYYTLFWNNNDPSVDFKPVLDLIKECDLEIVDMTYRSGDNRMVDYMALMTFGLNGTLEGMLKFERLAYQNPKLSQFSENSDNE